MKLIAYIPGTAAWRHRRDTTLCRRASQQINQIVDREIHPHRATKVLQAHLEACERCGTEADVVRALKRAIARVSGEADPEAVRRLEVFARQLCEGTQPRG